MGRHVIEWANIKTYYNKIIDIVGEASRKTPWILRPLTFLMILSDALKKTSLPTTWKEDEI